MLRLTPASHAEKIVDAGSFSVSFAGSESNVASSLAFMGSEVEFVTKLPENSVGDAAVRSLRSYGVSTSHILRGGKRIGTYFIEMGTSIRPSRVIYDREGSSISSIVSGEFSWEQILHGKSWVFISGITPALSPQCARETVLVASLARRLGVKVAFDFNFRRSLWNDPKEARVVFDEILENTDLLFGNVGALTDVYGMQFQGDTQMELTVNAIDAAHKQFGVSYLAFTVRDHISASHNVLSAVLSADNSLHSSRSYHVDVVDRFGSGDAFAAAVLHGLGKGWNHKKVVDFASAAFALKHTIQGDQHTSTEAEIQAIVAGGTSGHVIR